MIREDKMVSKMKRLRTSLYGKNEVAGLILLMLLGKTLYMCCAAMLTISL